MRLKVIAIQLMVVLVLGAVIYGYAEHLLKRYQTTEMTQQLLRAGGRGDSDEERIADHATNIAEMVIFMVDGRDVRHSYAGAARRPG